MSTWKINDLALEFDWNDFDDTDRFEKAEKAFRERDLEHALNGLSQRNQTKMYCESWNQYFDIVFGEGTSDRIFQGKRNRILTTNMAKAYTKFMKRARQEAMDEDLKAGREFEKASKDFIAFVEKHAAKDKSDESVDSKTSEQLVN